MLIADWMQPLTPSNPEVLLTAQNMNLHSKHLRSVSFLPRGGQVCQAEGRWAASGGSNFEPIAFNVSWIEKLQGNGPAFHCRCAAGPAGSVLRALG